MRTTALLVAVAALAACSKGETYESGGEADSLRDTTAHINVPDIDIGMTRDTLSVPTLSTRKDTIVVDKPVISGRKPVEVARPTVDVNKKP